MNANEREYQAKLLEILQRHRGRDNAVKGRYLARGMFGDALLSPVRRERKLRALVKDAVSQGHPVVGDSRGYYLAGSQEEVEAVVSTLRKHGLAELTKAARLKRISLKQFVGQLALELDERSENHGA